MSTPIENWKTWEGRTVEGKFPLRQWLARSDHSAVFLTERTSEPRKAAIKLIPAGPDSEGQILRWNAISKLSHPHLLRLFECGKVQIDERSLLYVVMEYAEEDLAQILPVRPLSESEATEMLAPTVQALASLLREGLVHGRIKPSNIMALENRLKISSDSASRLGEPASNCAPSPYDAPELAATGLSPACDVWSLGATLLAVLTQHEPKPNAAKAAALTVPESVGPFLRELLLRCLQVDPRRRSTLAELVRPSPPPVLDTVPVVEKKEPHARSRRWLAMPVALVLIFVGALMIRKLTNSPSQNATEKERTTVPVAAPTIAAPANAPAAEPAIPAAGRDQPLQKTNAGKPGSVLQQVNPDVSRNALNTITGHVKVSVQVKVEASGNVSEAKLVSAGPSKYFANRALAAAREWKFNPPQFGGQPVASEWMLHFQFGRGTSQVFPAQVKP